MDVTDRSSKMAEKIATRLRVRGEELADVTARAGRKLPRHLRAEAQILIDAESQQDHPKLSRQIDEKRLKRAERKLNAFLDRQDPWAERRGELLDLLAKIAFVLVTVVLAVFFTLLYRGYFD